MMTVVKYLKRSRFFRFKQRLGLILLASIWALFCLWYAVLLIGLFITDDEAQRVDRDRYFVDKRLLNLLYYNKTPSITKRENVQIIVLWTEWFGDPDWSEFWTVGDQLLQLSNNNWCYLTTSRRYLPKASAVLFHGRDFRFSDLPLLRFDWQRWIFYLLESPVNSFFKIRHWLVADTLQFNWTMNYRPSADVYAPYVYVEQRQNLTQKTRRELTARIKNLAAGFVLKKRMAFWLSSNCETSGRREHLVRELKLQGIQVDIFGACSFFQLKSPENFTSTLIADYRFYFAFENSYCEDYVTEKVTRGLQLSQLYGVIPVVYPGGEHCAKLLPTGSYIDALAFDSVEALASLLFDLAESSDATLIEPYFTWQLDYFVGNDNNWLKIHLIRGMTSLCRKLWQDDRRPSPNCYDNSNNETSIIITKEDNDENNIDCENNNQKQQISYSTVTNLRTALGKCKV